ALKPALPPPMTMRSYWRIREGAGSPPLAAEHDVDGFQDNGGIKDEREMADVIKVVFELALGVVKVGTVRIVHLRPAGDAGFHEVAEMVAGDLPFIAPHEFAPFRPGPDQAHIAPQDVPELGYFVEPGRAQPAAHARDARVMRMRVEIFRARVRTHGAELVEQKR